MLKLVRLALTAAILTAIAVRLRRRARIPAKPPEPPVERPRARSRMGSRMVLVWAAIAAIVAVTLAAAVLPTEPQRAADREWQAYQARQAALTAELGDPATLDPTASQASPGPTGPASPAPIGPAVTDTLSPVEIPDPNCSPVERPVTVRRIDPKVGRAVDRQWRRIERWLKANAPRTYRTLGEPGRARTIAVAESQMGVDFPDDLRASLLRHNGSKGHSVFGFWFHGAHALTVREIRDTWRRLCSWERTDRGNEPSLEYWNGRMIPFLHFAKRDSGDMEYAVADSAGGAVGWDDTVSGMAPRLPSSYALLRAVADALEQGGEIDGWRPAVKRGVLRWDYVEYE